MIRNVLPLLAVLAVPAYAELPPGSYNALRVQAGEALILQVTSVTTTASERRIEVTLKARVLKVERSKSGLTAGETITIRYGTFKGTPPPGPRPLRILKSGEIYPAFLNRQDDAFEPAAYGESFTMTPEGSVDSSPAPQ